jgi:DNA-binding Lrp family transcriptional regulator
MINKKDLAIISHLRTNARMPLTKMSRKIQIPVSTIFDRLKIGEREFIQKHTCLLDFSKLGYKIRSNIIFKVEREDKEALKDYLMKHSAVNSLYKINNGFDFMLEGVFKDMQEMERFMDELDKRFKITEKSSFYIIEDLKRESFMSNPNMIF